MLDAIRDAIAPTGPRGHPATTSVVTPQALAQLVSNERRRHTVRHIGEVGETTVAALAEYVAEAETDHDGEVTAAERKRSYVSLYQVHLNELDAHDVIEYDDEALSVARDVNLDAVLDVIQRIEELGGDA